MDGEGGEWVTIGEAARRAGASRAAIYGRIKRETLRTRPRGNRGVEVLWQGGDVAHDRNGDGNGDVTPYVTAALRDQLTELRREREAMVEAGDNLVEEMVALRERAARAEGAEATLREALADLATRLDRATDELRELRRPWWRRLVG